MCRWRSVTRCLQDQDYARNSEFGIGSTRWQREPSSVLKDIFRALVNAEMELSKFLHGLFIRHRLDNLNQTQKVG